MTMKPLNKNVIVKPDVVEEKYVGFAKPDSVVDQRPDTGEVIASASDLIAVGSRVLFNRNLVSRVQGMVVVQEDNIFAIL
jgi:co-chaperonin GroES (HSP10)